MTAEREIAGFTVPFAIGAISITLSTSINYTSLHLPAALSLLMAILPLLCLLHPNRREWHSLSVLALIIMAAAGCGFLIGFTHRITSVSSSPDMTVIPDRITALGAKMRHGIAALPFADSSSNALISALVTGDRTGLDKDITSTFRESGASHILALSGLHLGIIYGIISAIVSLMGSSMPARRLRYGLIVISCALYTAATGAGPSITRAFLFIFIGETARLTQRYSSTALTLMSALTIQLAFSPGSAGNIGFQLSYAAMAGIAFIFPWLKGFWPDGKGGLMKWIWNSAALSIACQITTGPLACLYFGTFAKHFLLTNLLALPLAGLVIPASLLTLALHSAGLCPDFLLTATETLIRIMTGCLKTIATM